MFSFAAVSMVAWKPIKTWLLRHFVVMTWDYLVGVAWNSAMASVLLFYWVPLNSTWLVDLIYFSSQWLLSKRLIYRNVKLSGVLLDYNFGRRAETFSTEEGVKESDNSEAPQLTYPSAETPLMPSRSAAVSSFQRFASLFMAGLCCKSAWQ